MKSAVSSFDLFAIISELQTLVGAKIDKIFQQEKPKEEFLISMHVPSKGKRLLYLSIPRVVCMTTFKPSFPTPPPSFCMSLRRKIGNAIIKGISQHGFERVLIIDLFSKLGPSKLIIELFSPGNVVLCDENGKILSALHYKIWNDNRKILAGKPYVFPNPQLDPRTLTKESFRDLLQSSDKESLVKTLAMECSLGGLYAEEILLRAKVSKNLLPRDVSSSDQETILSTLQQLFLEELVVWKKDNEVFPRKLISQEGVIINSSFNEVVSSLVLERLEKEERKESLVDSTTLISKTQKVIKVQEKQLENLKTSALTNQKKGELLYNHYQEVQEILSTIVELKKTLSWTEIKEKVKQVPIIKNIDEHTGTISIELE